MKMYVVLFLISLLAVSCDDDDARPDAKMFMTFDPRFDGEDFQMGETHTNVHGYPFQVSDIKFYISNLQLHKAGGGQVKISDIELIAMQDNRRSLEYLVPEGNYLGLSYDLGVPYEMNGANDPDFSISQFPVGHPLNETTSSGMYWQWSQGYRFFSFDGRYDIEPNTDSFLPTPFAFHTGTDTLFRELGLFEKVINLDPGQTLILPFAIDIDSIFATATDTIDLAEVSSFHGTEAQMETGIKLANNMAKAFVLK